MLIHSAEGGAGGGYLHGIISLPVTVMLTLLVMITCSNPLFVQLCAKVHCLSDKQKAARSAFYCILTLAAYKLYLACAPVQRHSPREDHCNSHVRRYSLIHGGVKERIGEWTSRVVSASRLTESSPAYSRNDTIFALTRHPSVFVWSEIDLETNLMSRPLSGHCAHLCGAGVVSGAGWTDRQCYFISLSVVLLCDDETKKIQ